MTASPLLSLPTARALHAAGLAWQPAEFDFFAIPDRDLDDRVFVINRMPAGRALLHGQPVFTFDGAAEWALDYIAAGEVLWLPTEAQLREQLAERLAAEPGANLGLAVQPSLCRCEIRYRGERFVFENATGAEAYAAALLHVLSSQSTS